MLLADSTVVVQQRVIVETREAAVAQVTFALAPACPIESLLQEEAVDPVDMQVHPVEWVVD
jgi:hypothetical protein